MTRISLLVAIVPLLAGVVGCSGGPGGAGKVQAAATACHPASPLTRSPSGFPEVQGSGQGVSLWGLLMFAHHGAPRVGEQAKIVWRMTGTGPIVLTAIGPGGQRVRLAWGPVEHESSNFNKPGDEWGAGYVFTAPGCWDLRAVRGGLHADVLLTVVR